MHPPRLAPPQSQVLSRFTTGAIAAAFVGGVIVTAYGFLAIAPPTAGGTTWRWTASYLVLLVVATASISLLSRRIGPRGAGIAATTLMLVVLGAAVPAAVTVLVMCGAFSLGRLVFRATDTAATDRILAGLAILGSAFGALAAMPVHYPGLWALVLGVPVALGWRALADAIRTLTLKAPPTTGGSGLLECCIYAASLLHVLVGLMPETGHDALAMHMFVPSRIAHARHWGFDASNYVWAVMPMLVDWLYAIGYLLGGETAARLINVSGTLMLALLLKRISTWAGASDTAGKLGVLLFLVTPLSFLESSSLFVDSIWTALLVGGTFALLRTISSSGNKRADSMLGGLLLGGALAAKAVSAVVLPAVAALMVLFWRRWRSGNRVSIAVPAVAVMIVVGCVPYLRAYAMTGNPVFPFFNGLFQSPLYPSVNFNADTLFPRGASWTTPYSITFNSSQHLEGTMGAAGFQWLLIVLPGAAAVLLRWHRRGMLLAALGAAWLVLTFSQMGYLRYVLPTTLIGCAVVAVALTTERQASRISGPLALLTCAAAVLLNLLHFHAATFTGNIDVRAIADAAYRSNYVAARAPIRAAVGLINAINDRRTPVAFISAPFAAGLSANALYANWYNTSFNAELLAVSSGESLRQVLQGRGVEYMVADPAWGQGRLQEHIEGISDPVASFGPVTVWRLRTTRLEP